MAFQDPPSSPLRGGAALSLGPLFAPHWGWIALRGVAAIVFGLLAFALPGLTVAVMVAVWGAYALIDGVLALVAGWRIRDNGRPLWSVIVLGLLGIAAGVVTFVWPALTALTLILIIGFWAIAGACSRSSLPSGCARRSRASGCMRCRACCRWCSAWRWWPRRAPAPWRWPG